jgi:peptidyl-prolyl cis-trans isomerase SurA
MMRDSRFFPSATLLASSAFLALTVASSAQAQSLRASPSLSLPGAISSAQRSADFIVAVVNSEPITNNEVRSRVFQIEQQLSGRGAAMPARAELARDVLERLINERAQVQLARESGIRVDEQAIDNAVQNVARQNQLSLAQLRQRMREDGMDYNALRNNLRDELLLTRIREREVEPRVRVSDADVDQFIREQRDGTDGGNFEINLAQILVAVPESANAQQLAALQAKMDRAAARARAGEDFALLVREFSDASQGNGGQMGLRSPDRYPDIFVDATRNLRNGGLSEVIRSGAGFHLLKLVEKRQLGLENLTLTQTRSRHILLRTTAQLSESAAVERLRLLRARIAAGSLEFAAAARDNSQDGSAREGGDLGWANPGQFVPEFEEVMNSIAPGQISEPVVSRYGVHLIQVTERRNRQLNEREQREAARGALREKKLDEAFVNWAQEVRARAYVEMREPPQ